MTIKTSLKHIIRDPGTIPLITQLVYECHDIMIKSYQLIRLYFLNRYHLIRYQLEQGLMTTPPRSLLPTQHELDPINPNDSYPPFDQTLMTYFINTGGVQDVRGRPPKQENQLLIKDLQTFYDMEFQPLINQDKYSLKGKSQVKQYLGIELKTCIETNISMHFAKRLLHVMTVLNPFPELNRHHLQKLLSCLLNNEVDRIIREDHKLWCQIIREDFLPPLNSESKSHSYQLKVNPIEYLYYTFLMNETLETYNERILSSTTLTENQKKQKLTQIFQPLSLRHHMTPCYITLDSQVMIDLFCEGKKKDLKEDRDGAWKQIIRTERKVMNKKGFHFTTIKTDGVGVSICFERDGYDSKKPKHKTEPKELYLDELSETDLEVCRSRKLVSGDQGKHDLIRMMDDDGIELRYTNCQRRFESKRKRSDRIIRHEKHTHQIEKYEQLLSNVNSKTVNYQRFKEYIKLKTFVDGKVKDFYQEELYRKIRWRVCIGRRKSEDQFLKQIEETYGKPKEILLCVGDWSQNGQMRNLLPSLGVGLRSLLRKRYRVVLVHEYGTSKYCFQCYDELQHYQSLKTAPSSPHHSQEPVRHGSWLKPRHLEKEAKRKGKFNFRIERPKVIVPSPPPNTEAPKMCEEHRKELRSRLHRVLWCPHCQSMSPEGVTTWFFNRDTNACRNMLFLANEWFRNRTRPLPFRRVKKEGELQVVDREVTGLNESGT